MIVAEAIKLLQELDPDSVIAGNWYTQEDLEKYGVDNEDTLTEKVWTKAVSIFENYEFQDMYYALEQAIDEAENQLTKEKKKEGEEVNV
jgi:ribosome-associated translation inhibitor RaiA